MNSSKRNYSMTDADLCMFTSNLVVTMTRDQTEFTARGITSTMVTALETLGNAFEVLPNDVYYLADIMEAAENKTALRDSCTIKLRSILGYVKIKWGSGSPQVRRFDAGDMTRQDDKKFLVTCRMAVRIATDYLSDLTSIGLTDAMIDDLEATAQQLEDTMNDIATAQANRDIKAQERADKGNEIYSYVSRYCEIGKIIWEDVSEAKYNDYIIYGGSSSGLSKPQNLIANWTSGDPLVNLTWDIVSGADSYDIYHSPVNFGMPSGTYVFLIDMPSSPSGVPFTVNKRNYYKIKAKSGSTTSDFSDEAWTEVVDGTV
ncbi:MAG: hypothetical protein NT007_06200 [Candidatus Kapabacteria bacterium]|nr:hypothetical protein [Candidatus Kapabacteria bacterium]